MNRIVVLLSLFLGCSIKGFSQDYSNRGLMDIRDEAEARRVEWTRAFEEAVQRKSYAGLASPRQSSESFIELQLSQLRRLYGQGDARGLLTAIINYLTIEKQFVKDVMRPAEAIKPEDQETIDKINQKIADFGEKEKPFLIEINNALMSERDDIAPQQEVKTPDNDPEEEPKEGTPGEKTKTKKKSKTKEKTEDKDEDK